MQAPATPPIGLTLARASKVVRRAFDDALSAAGGSVPVWLILLSVKTRQLDNQRELADSVGIREATLTHHLNAMTEQGLLTRERDPANRRIHRIRLTEAGEATFLRLRGAATDFDAGLRAGFSAEEVAVLEGLLGRMAASAARLAVASDLLRGGGT